MNIKASGRSALIIAAGFWLCVSGPLQAAEDADGGVTASSAESAAGAPVALNKFTKKSRKHVSSYRKSVKVASKASTGNAKTSEKKASEHKASEKKASEKKKAVEADAVLKDDDSPSALPPAVANANAQLAAADLSADANSVSTKASNMLRTMAAKQGDSAEPQVPAPAANTELVAADQLNDVDRALSENKSEDKPVLTPTVAMAMAQAPAAVSNDDSTWGQTSLIGKIFIAFGGLLTLASAARMLMA
jgi:K+-transporting ATPase c subunit